MDDAASLKGRLLVASPRLIDGNFDRSIVYVIEHAEEGAVGVVINRPSEREVMHAVPHWWEKAALPPVMFVGGPVSRSVAICLGIASAPVDELAATAGFRPVAGDVGVVDLAQEPDSVPVSRVRVFAGYAGWGAGQLEDEIAAAAWFVVEALPSDLIASDPKGLWRQVLRRQEQPSLTMLASYPPDPALN